MSDTFEGLLQDRRLNIAVPGQITHCPSIRPDPNIVFPVTGDIGLNEVINTFVGLNTDDSLLSVTSDSKLTTDAPPPNPPPAKPAKGAAPKKASDDTTHNVPVLADTLMFTSTFEGSASPTVTLMPGKTAGLAKATYIGDHTRTDKNTVIIGLSYRPIGNAAVVTRPYIAPLGIGAPVAGSTATVFAHRTAGSAEDRAINATIEQQYNTFIQNRAFGN